MKYADAMIQHTALDHIDVQRLIVTAKPGDADKPEAFTLAAREAIILSMLCWANVQLHQGEQTWMFRFNELVMRGELVEPDEMAALARLADPGLGGIRPAFRGAGSDVRERE